MDQNAPRTLALPRRPASRPLDVLIVLLAFAANAFVEDRPGDELVFRSIADLPAVAVLLIAVGSVALLWRRERPVDVLWLLVALSVPMLLLEEGANGALIFALYASGRHADASLPNALGAQAAVLLIALGTWRLGGPISDTIAAVVVPALVWSVGRWLRLRSERADQMERRHRAESERALADERTRIARELHDIVAHNVSLMTVQAGAARTVAATDPDAARAAMAAVEEAGRQVLGELRHLLGVLRPATDADGLVPQPGLGDLTGLVEGFVDAGLRVELHVDPALGDGVPARLGLSAYRIVQESLTNVLKHAGVDPLVTVSVGTDGAGIVVEVVDDGRGEPELAGVETGGHGLLGMRERAALLGGTLEAGPLRGGGFRVTARLPLDQEST